MNKNTATYHTSAISYKYSLQFETSFGFGKDINYAAPDGRQLYNVIVRSELRIKVNFIHLEKSINISKIPIYQLKVTSVASEERPRDQTWKDIS